MQIYAASQCTFVNEARHCKVCTSESRDDCTACWDFFEIGLNSQGLRDCISVVGPCKAISQIQYPIIFQAKLNNQADLNLWSYAPPRTGFYCFIDNDPMPGSKDKALSFNQTKGGGDCISPNITTNTGIVMLCVDMFGDAPQSNMFLWITTHGWVLCDSNSGSTYTSTGYMTSDNNWRTYCIELVYTPGAIITIMLEDWSGDNNDHPNDGWFRNIVVFDIPALSCTSASGLCMNCQQGVSQNPVVCDIQAYMNTTLGKCISCNVSCNQCSGDGNTMCQVCATGYLTLTNLNSSIVCYATCPDGYYPLNGLTCESCALAMQNCVKCTAVDVCINCGLTLFLQSTPNSCLDSCALHESGRFQIYLDPPPFAGQGNMCVTSCPTNQVVNLKNICYTCDASCAASKCLLSQNPKQCTQCADPSQYSNPQIESDNFFSCIPVYQTAACILGYFLPSTVRQKIFSLVNPENICATTCPLLSKPDPSSVCTMWCPLNCQACQLNSSDTTQIICSTCKNNFILRFDQTFCVLACTEENANGYFPSLNVNSTSQCGPCDSICKDCDQIALNCTVCDNTKFFITNECATKPNFQCPSSVFPILQNPAQYVASCLTSCPTTYKPNQFTRTCDECYKMPTMYTLDKDKTNCIPIVFIGVSMIVIQKPSKYQITFNDTTYSLLYSDLLKQQSLIKSFSIDGINSTMCNITLNELSMNSSQSSNNKAFQVNLSFATGTIINQNALFSFNVNINNDAGVFLPQMNMLSTEFQFSLDHYIFCEEKQFFNQTLQNCQDRTLSYKPEVSITTNPKILTLDFITTQGDNSTFIDNLDLTPYINLTDIAGLNPSDYNYTIKKNTDGTYAVYIYTQKDIVNQPDASFALNLPPEIVKDQPYYVDTTPFTAKLLDDYNMGQVQTVYVGASATAAGIGAAIVQITSILTTVISGNTGGAGSLLMLSLIELLKYQNVAYAPNVRDIFTSVQSFPPNFLTSPVYTTIDKKDVRAMHPRFILNGVSPYFLNNYLESFCQIVVFTLAAICFTFIKRVMPFPKNRRIKQIFKVCDWIYMAFVWNLPILIIITKFLGSFFYSVANLTFLPVTAKGQMNSFLGIAVIFLMVMIIFIFTLAIKSCKIIMKEIENKVNKTEKETRSLSQSAHDRLNKSPYQESQFIQKLISVMIPKEAKNRELFLKQTTLLYCDFKSDHWVQQYFLVIDLARVALICAIVGYMPSWPLFQTFTNLIVLVIYDILLIAFRPHKSNFLLVMVLLIEGCISICYLLSFVLAMWDNFQYNSSSSRKLIGIAMGICCLIVMYTAAAMFFVTIYRLYNHIKSAKFARRVLMEKLKQEQEEQAEQLKKELLAEMEITKNSGMSPLTLKTADNAKPKMKYHTQTMNVYKDIEQRKLGKTIIQHNDGVVEAENKQQTVQQIQQTTPFSQTNFANQVDLNDKQEAQTIKEKEIEQQTTQVNFQTQNEL